MHLSQRAKPSLHGKATSCPRRPLFSPKPFLLRACSLEKICLAILLGVSVFSCRGNVEYNSRVWQIEDGLPHPVVQAIAQTTDGYLWVGTREGLARFDGLRFSNMIVPGVIRQPNISALCVGPSNELWIGTADCGLLRLRNGTFSSFGAADGLKTPILALMRASNGVLWIGDNDGCCQFFEGHFARPPQPRLTIHSICEDGMGGVWCGTEPGGLECWKGKAIRQYTEKEGLLVKYCRSVYCAPDDTIWVGSIRGITTVKNEKMTRMDMGTGPVGHVSAFLQDDSGTFWVGTYGGLMRYVNGELAPVGKDQTSSSIYCIVSDREGNVWVGSEDGLSQFVPTPFTVYTTKTGLSDNRTISVCGGPDGSIYIGAWGGGVNCIKNNRITALTKAQGLSSDLVYSLCAGHDGSLWVGMDVWFGLDRVQNGQVRHYGREQGLTGPNVSVLYEDAQNRLWAGTHNGLYLLQGGRFARLKGLAHSQINVIAPGAGGLLWIGTETGIVSLDNGRMTPLQIGASNSTNAVLALYEDPDGYLWIGTKNEGLKRYRDGQLLAQPLAQGLLDNVIYAIQEDESRQLWLSTGKGIFRLAKDQFEKACRGDADGLACVRYGRNEGIASSSQFIGALQPASWKGLDGRLWFRTTKGVVVVDPKKVTRNTHVPPVMVEDVLLDKKRAVDLPNLPPGRGELEIDYTALSLTAPERVHFKYRLWGYDRDWVDAGNRRFAYYNNLSPGSYRFQVLAANNDGVWNNSGAQLSFVLTPHYWQTKWFSELSLAAALVLVAGIVRLFYRRRMQRMLHFYEEEQALVRERSRIARDIHDDLGARVTLITLLSQATKSKNPDQLWSNSCKIATASQQMAQSLDEIVWAVDPRHDTLPSVVEYLSHQADDLLEETNIRLKLNRPKDVPNHVVSARLRHQLFLAVSEALNNAVKHSQATQMEIDISLVKSRFQIIVSDNGVGFDPQDQKEKGHGMSNMQARLKNIEGNFEITSQPGRGARVLISVEIKSPRELQKNGVASTLSQK